MLQREQGAGGGEVDDDGDRALLGGRHGEGDRAGVGQTNQGGQAHAIHPPASNPPSEQEARRALPPLPLELPVLPRGRIRRVASPVGAFVLSDAAEIPAGTAPKYGGFIHVFRYIYI